MALFALTTNKLHVNIQLIKERKTDICKAARKFNFVEVQRI